MSPMLCCFTSADENTPLHMAILRHHTDIAEALIQKLLGEQVRVGNEACCDTNHSVRAFVVSGGRVH